MGGRLNAKTNIYLDRSGDSRSRYRRRSDSAFASTGREPWSMDKDSLRHKYCDVTSKQDLPLRLATAPSRWSAWRIWCITSSFLAPRCHNTNPQDIATITHRRKHCGLFIAGIRYKNNGPFLLASKPRYKLEEPKNHKLIISTTVEIINLNQFPQRPTLGNLENIDII